MQELVLMAAMSVAGSPAESPQQVIVVRAASWGSQRAQLRRFRWDDGSWVRVGRVVPAWLGVNGLAPASTRRQNTGTTPAGVFGLPEAFGRVQAGAIEIPYRRITGSSYWPYDPRDPRTYNVLQDRRVKAARWRADGQWSERLVDYGRQYRLAVVIGYNLPAGVYEVGSGERRAALPAKVHKGGGIFLHVTRGRPTAGCISVPWPDMRRIARWLDPGAAARIVVGPRAVTRGWRQDL